MAPRVLISGAGIAGCCLAWWLDRYGYDVTLVEQAPAPRKGGYVIDFWGHGYDIAEHMGLLPDIEPFDLRIEEMRIVDGKGRRISGIDQKALRSMSGGRMMSLQRSALALALFRAVEGRIESRFGDSIAALEQDASGVSVVFASGERGRYDLIAGADGLHSNVRRLVFGPEGRFERFLGDYAAAFTAAHYPHRDEHVYVMYGQPGRQIARITLSGDRSVFLLMFRHDRPLDVAEHDRDAQKVEVQRIFDGMGGESDAVLAALAHSDDLYFDRMSQIEMPTWSARRVVLVGDACACPSLLAGQGSALAMIEAYVLAGELKAAQGDYRRAFSQYERRLKPMLASKQKSARSFASSMVPKTAFGLWLRNRIMGLISLPGLDRLAFKGLLDDGAPLPDY